MTLTYDSKSLSPPIGGDLQRLNAALSDSYSKQARSYDACRTMSVNGRFFFEVAHQAIEETIGPTDQDTVHVDMPVGTGRFLHYLRDRGRTHQMLGIDLAPGMLQACRSGIRHREGTISLTMGDAFGLPLADDSVDIFTSIRFFHLFPRRHWPALLAEMQRVIRPGGFVIAELRNQLRGVVGALIVERRDRWFYGGRRRCYIWPHQVSSLFSAWERIQTRGVGLDGLGRLSTVAPQSARRLHGLTRYSPWRYLAKELLVKAYKPPQ